MSSNLHDENISKILKQKINKLETINQRKNNKFLIGSVVYLLMISTTD